MNNFNFYRFLTVIPLTTDRRPLKNQIMFYKRASNTSLSSTCLHRQENLDGKTLLNQQKFQTSSQFAIKEITTQRNYNTANPKGQ